ncbi:hypothetical protein MVEN_02159700 [Mycena venus]|uniref:Uncharacterized protein n=1 Tax=Mycena venus TaxID=2733690 RepID=A0A8H6X8N7_9AGAR|nr:hypothetical protein MVEN_02159700 [Mycena venus]
MADVQAHTARLIALFVSCVLYVIAMQDVIDAFINYHGPGGALEFYGNIHTLNIGWIHSMPVVNDSIQATLGDALIIYRCYVLYDRNWHAIAAPSLAWIGLVAVSIASSYREATLTGGESLNDASVLPILSAALLLTFATSIITTYLIIRRLCMIKSLPNMHDYVRPHIITRIATIFFETGLVYTLSIIVSLGLYLSGSSLQYVASLACLLYILSQIVHIIPITCNLLLIRVEGVSRKERLESGPNIPVPASSGLKFNPKAANEV